MRDSALVLLDSELVQRDPKVEQKINRFLAKGCCDAEPVVFQEPSEVPALIKDCDFPVLIIAFDKEWLKQWESSCFVVALDFKRPCLSARFEAVEDFFGMVAAVMAERKLTEPKSPSPAQSPTLFNEFLKETRRERKRSYTVAFGLNWNK